MCKMQAKVLGCLLLVFLSLSYVSAGYKLTEEQKEFLHDAKNKCESEHNTPAELIDQAHRGILANDEGLKEFLFCFFKRIMFMHDDGSFNVDHMRTVLSTAIENGLQVTEICTANSGPSPTENAFQYAQCFHDHVTDHSLEMEY